MRIFNQVSNTQRGLFAGMTMLKQYHLSYRESAQALSSLCFSFIQAEMTAEMLNDLHYRIKESKARREIEQAAIDRSLPFFPIEFDPKKKLFRVTVKHPDAIDACIQNTAAMLAKAIASLDAMNEAIAESDFHPAPIVDHLKLVEQDLKEDRAPLPHYSADRNEFMEQLNPVFTFPTWDSVERDEDHKRVMLTDVIAL